MLFEQQSCDDDIQNDTRVHPMTGPATEGTRVQLMAQVDSSNDTARFFVAQGGSFDRSTPVDMFDGANIQSPHRPMPSHSNETRQQHSFSHRRLYGAAVPRSIRPLYDAAGAETRAGW